MSYVMGSFLNTWPFLKMILKLFCLSSPKRKLFPVMSYSNIKQYVFFTVATSIALRRLLPTPQSQGVVPP